MSLPVMLDSPEGLGNIRSLHLDFMTGAAGMDSRLTYTGGDQGSFFGADGLMKFSAGDEPRFDHKWNGVEWVPQGLLVEPIRINRISQSETFGAPWVSIGTPALFSNNAVAPDGTMSMDRTNDTAFNGFEGISHILGAAIPPTNVPYTYSVYIQKFVQSTFPEFQLDFTGGTRTRAICQFDTETGATVFRTGDPDGGPRVVVKELPNHWRLELTTNNVGLNTQLQIVVFPAVTTTFGVIESSALGGVNLWGHQLEGGDYATSLIRTTGTPATRFADVCEMNDDGWLNPREGTLLTKGTGFAPVTDTTEKVCASIGNGTNDDDNVSLAINNGADSEFTVRSGNAVQATLADVGAYVPNTLMKMAGSWKANNFARVQNAGILDTDESGLVPVGLAKLTVGGKRTGVFADPWGGHIQEISYYNKAVAPTVLSQLTRP